MGFAAALFALGSRTLVASVVPVPDDATRPLMTAFHGRLAAGETPATALARAQASVSDDLGVSPAATAGFVCLGA
jgi:CHAT domain-containing protein